MLEKCIPMFEYIEPFIDTLCLFELAMNSNFSLLLTAYRGIMLEKSYSMFDTLNDWLLYQKIMPSNRVLFYLHLKKL